MQDFRADSRVGLGKEIIMKEVVEYHKLRPEQLVKRRTEMPVAYIGLGILEWHGLHNPLGLDGVKANGIASYLAERLGGVVMPAQYWGDNRELICELVFDPEISSWLPEGTKDHTLEICSKMGIEKQAFQADAQRSRQKGGWRLWEELTVHAFFQIETLGFKTIVAIPGHYPLFEPLDRAVNTYYSQGGNSPIFTLKDQLFSEDGNAGDHAAMFETSLMMALYPKLVDMNRLDSDMTKPNIGVLGEDPRCYASKEFGFKILSRFEDIIKCHIKKILR